MKLTKVRGVRDHIMCTRDITAQLKNLEVTMSDSFLVHYIFTLFGSKESRWMESTKERKFLEIWVSTVWLFCQEGKNACFWWVPRLRTFPPRLGGKERKAIN
ncbi:hypothetical protein QL285_088901 [Trifolium repens]|nr:hypothetical protein QL285_088901 [Trifolium repens]